MEEKNTAMETAGTETPVLSIGMIFKNEVAAWNGA